MEQAITKADNTSLTYGKREDVNALARRIKTMVPGGKELYAEEALALAQVSLVTGCNPFIGEIWYIHKNGPSLGIRGARKHANQQMRDAGGPDAYYSKQMIPCPGEEAGYTGNIKDLAGSFKCILTDSVSTEKHMKLFTEMLTSLREAGDPDPVGTAKEMLGGRPQWIGYGISTVSEKSRMNKQALAQKRAEAAALKLKFDIPFGANVAAADMASEADDVDWVDAEPEPEPDPPLRVITDGEKQTQNNLDHVVRPYTPEQLKQFLQLKANENQRTEKLSANTNQRGLTAGMIEQCFAGDPKSKDMRHTLLLFLTGHGSTKDLSGIWIHALLDWLEPKKDSGNAYHVSNTVIQEAKAAWNEALKNEGQLTLGGLS